MSQKAVGRLGGNQGTISEREQQVNVNTHLKENRDEHVVLEDCFSTTAFENQARCSICPKSLSVQVNIKMFRNELLISNKTKGSKNANVKNSYCH